MRIVFGSNVAREPVLKVLREVPDIELVEVNDLAEIAPLVESADALVLSDPRGKDGAAIAAALRQPGCRVKWIQITTAGANGLLVHGVPAGVTLTNQGGAVAPTVAEHAMAMILAMTRRIPEITARSARHEWNKDFTPALYSLEGKTLAIVGYGNLGRQLAKRARGFDVKIVGLSRSLKSDPLADEIVPMTAINETLARADIVAVCIASTPSTRHVVDAAAFASMKQGAFFVNVSRGETVDQVALRQALVDKRLAGAFIDVTEPEPLPADDPLWDAPNLIISPHTAGAGGVGTGGRIAKVVKENIELFKAGRPLLHQVKE
ncbi:D-glycerate dehydrogenase [soil metagenome]